MSETISIRALRSLQGGIPVYSFFLPGPMVLEIADICRLTRSAKGLDGFQREAIQRHINSIVEYLNRGEMLFPNAILLALSPRAKFTRSRGPTPGGLIEAAQAGLLTLPKMREGQKCAWIVDGQQRSTALARAADGSLSVPIVAFASDDLQVHREQFILVNKARPLPKRMVDELLPELDARHLPTDMAMRQIPSALVERLDADSQSPFHGLVRRTTNGREPRRVVLDSALLKMLHRQIYQPLGLLARMRSLDGTSTDPGAMYDVVCQFWGEVKTAFPDAWGLPPERSRLMHSAGIAAMGALMDHLAPRLGGEDQPARNFGTILRKMVHVCAWTQGRWPDMDCAWNAVENTSRGVRQLTDQLIRLATSSNLRQVA